MFGKLKSILCSFYDFVKDVVILKYKILYHFLRLFRYVLPAILVLYVLEYTLQKHHILSEPPVKIIRSVEMEPVHEIIPQTQWSHLEPCGVYFNEQEEYQRAKQCVNDKVWSESPILNPVVPRCYVISTESPDLISSEGFNAIPLITWYGVGRVVGFYDPDTFTVYIVENHDSAMIYRHELQHFFLHLHDPLTGGGGHYQDIWEKCEPPYYERSISTKINDLLKKSESLD